MISMHTVNLRGGFSDRNNLQKFNTELQIKNFDKRTRTLFVNTLHEWIFERYKHHKTDFFKKAIKEVFSEIVDEDMIWRIQYRSEEIFGEYIEEIIINDKYDAVLTLIEYTTLYYQSCDKEGEFYRERYNFIMEMNTVFQQEFVGYRFIGDIIVPISDQIEVETIQIAVKNPFDGCRVHLQKALVLISDRENPDYKNSIKESISAVESICQIITGDSKATLGQALKLLEGKGIAIHKAMEKSFSSLYGYTSDEGGIRHAEGLFESNVTFEEAKYMLVSCCAFVNYLVAEYGKIK